MCICLFSLSRILTKELCVGFCYIEELWMRLLFLSCNLMTVPLFSEGELQVEGSQDLKHCLFRQTGVPGFLHLGTWLTLIASQVRGTPFSLRPWEHDCLFFFCVFWSTVARDRSWRWQLAHTHPSIHQLCRVSAGKTHLPAATAERLLLGANDHGGGTPKTRSHTSRNFPAQVLSHFTFTSKSTRFLSLFFFFLFLAFLIKSVGRVPWTEEHWCFKNLYFKFSIPFDFHLKSQGFIFMLFMCAPYHILTTKIFIKNPEWRIDTSQIS